MAQIQINPPASLSDEFLDELVRELDHEDIVGITLGGSYARGDATPYSDIDLACFWREGLRPPPKRFMYRRGKLVSVKMTNVAEMLAMLSRPESALLFANGKRRLLLDKDGSLARFEEEIARFRWETLQPAAYESISLWMMLMAEEVHKTLREFQQNNEPGLAYATSDIVTEMTLLAALYFGEMITNNSTYYQQVEAAAGNNSAWTYNHRIATGLEEGPAGIKPTRARGIAALYLYRETLALVKSVMQAEQLAVAEQTLRIVAEAVRELSFTEEEQQWLKSWI